MLTESDGIILQSRKYGDSSKILTVFTNEYGKISLIAKGCRSPKSKFAAMLEPISCLRLYFYKKHNRDLHLLSNSELINPFRSISSSFDKLTSALLLLETTIQTLHQDEKNSEVYDLLKSTLELINDTEKEPFSIYLKFSILLTALIGFELYKDYDLSGSENQYLYYNFENGTLFDNKNNLKKNFFRLDRKLAIKLNEINGLNLEEAGSILFEDTEKAVLLSFISGFFTYHLDKNINFKTIKLII